MIGFVIGYVIGTRAGEEGFTEMRDAVKSIATSGELKELLAGGISILGDVLSQGRGALSEAQGSSIRRVA